MPSTIAKDAAPQEEAQIIEAVGTPRHSNRPARHLVAPIATRVQTPDLVLNNSVLAAHRRETTNKSFQPAVYTAETPTRGYARARNALHT